MLGNTEKKKKKKWGRGGGGLGGRQFNFPFTIHLPVIWYLEYINLFYVWMSACVF